MRAGGTEVIGVTNLTLAPHFAMLFEVGRRAALRFLETRLVATRAPSERCDPCVAPALATGTCIHPLPRGRHMTLSSVSTDWPRILLALPNAMLLSRPSPPGRTTAEIRVLSSRSVLRVSERPATPPPEASEAWFAPGSGVQMALRILCRALRERPPLSRFTSRRHAETRFRAFRREERLSTATDVAFRHLEVRQSAHGRGPEGVSSRRPASHSSPARERRTSREAHAAELDLSARAARSIAPRATALSPSPAPAERRFRAPEPTPQPAAPKAQPVPQLRTAPKPPEIDIGQLDKELWRRFEKRFRVEQERRGRR